MANPSDTGPSGVGTEVLRRRYVDGSAETLQILCAGVSNHIMTILSVVICSVGSPADTLFDMYIDYDLGGTNLNILRNTAIGTNQTYIFSDKIILTDTDRLTIQAYSTTQRKISCPGLGRIFQTRHGSEIVCVSVSDHESDIGQIKKAHRCGPPRRF